MLVGRRGAYLLIDQSSISTASCSSAAPAFRYFHTLFALSHIETTRFTAAEVSGKVSIIAQMGELYRTFGVGSVGGKSTKSFSIYTDAQTNHL